MKYIPTIGLEIHAELKTQTKMFCNSKNDSEEKRPNVNICPICTGHPGTLPVINKEAVKHVLKLGLAVNGALANFTEFDRKNYFYPDIPKGYQISQYKHPLVLGGEIRGIALTRIHLEEDTARSTHHGDYSLVDFNRAGVPLMELVTEPVIHSGGEAVLFARELQLLLQYLHAGNANMEKGEMRVEANISVSTNKTLGTKVEVKNLNSFRAVERAIEYEINRQSKLLEQKEKIIQETRGWDEGKGITFSQRAKEDSHDYRYFPDPDIPKLFISEVPEFNKEKLSKELSELPWQKRKRYLEVFGLKETDVEIFIHQKEWCELFEQTIVNFKDDKKLIQLTSNYIVSDLAGLSKTGNTLGNITSDSLASLIHMIGKGEVSSRGGKDILKVLYEKGGDPRELAKEMDLIQKSDENTLTLIVKKVLKSHPNVVAEYRSGKENALQFLIGQGMKESQGGANPEILSELFRKILS
ncbi:MAG: Asp-tRNA(Asn)/Glu-tRNA(Gln) amidotransferase subunit GatB [Patescibacteria group bacterium]